MKKKSISKLKKAVWVEFSRYIRLKDSINGYNSCYTCGDVRPISELQAGHLLDGRTNSILFEERAVFPQCYTCNCCKSGLKEVFIPKFIDEFGREEYDDLMRLKHQTRKFSVEELEEMKKHYKQLQEPI